MPKTTKREATKRAARIAKAHATELPKLEVKTTPPPVKRPGYRPPTRGVARYPWASVILTLLIIGLAVYTLYYFHLGPWTLPKPKQTVVASCTTTSILNKITDVSPAPGAATIQATKHTYASPPTMSIDTNKIYCAGINTNKGLIVIELDPKIAPNTVNNFVFLAQNHFFDGLVFHRVLQKSEKSSGSGPYIIQTGDPTGTGNGGPGYTFNDEPVQGDYTLGAVAMAHPAAKNTNGSQFFICTADDSSILSKSYNLFGHVVKGMDVALAIQGPGDDASTKNIKPDTMNHVIVVAA